MFITKRHLPRRTFLKSAGCTLGLPLLEQRICDDVPLCGLLTLGPCNLSCAQNGPYWKCKPTPLSPYWTQTVRGEYLDVPALCLTRDQVQRLWGCEGALCDEILGELIKTHFLEQTADGRFVRASCSLRS